VGTGKEVVMTENENPVARDPKEAVSRRTLAKKIAYVVPVAFAVIAASEKPLAASSGGLGPPE
jgi:hypothetical protein